MKSLKGISGFYVSVGILGVAVLGSAFFYKREADKATRLKAEVQRAADDLSGIRNRIPTEDHREFVAKQKQVIETNFKTIADQVLRWNYIPQEEWTPPRFVGRLRETKDMIAIAAAAAGRRIRIDSKAAYLGFDEYKTTPPDPDVEDIQQLQKELSAATDIAQLLITSNVHSIDLMTRRENALMEEGTSTTSLRLGTDFTTSRRTRLKADLYDTVPFRVSFTCVYPALAQFMKYLVTPGKVTINEFGKVVRRPQNFLVMNDFWFTVQGESEQELELRRKAEGTTRTGALAGIIPEDLPDAAAWYNRDPRGALNFFAIWRRMTPEQKKIWIIDKKLGEQIPREEQERLLAERNRVLLEFNKRQQLEGKARPPGYNLIQVTMLIDFVQFKNQDGDGLPDIAEHAYGTDPKKKDSDGDGIDDGQELWVVGTDPLKRDTDGDGASDGDELAAGTDPTSPPTVAGGSQPEELKASSASLTTSPM